MIGWNASAAAMLLGAGVWVALGLPESTDPAELGHREPMARSYVVRRGAERGVMDATGQFVPIRPYRRIVSGSIVADGMLLELCEPTRVLRFTNASAKESPFKHRFAEKGMDDPLENLEGLIALKPDLVLTHNLGNAERVARLREAGITVFDFGEMRGLLSLLPNLRTLGTLLEREERGAELARRFARRMGGVAANLPDAHKPGGLYVAVYGDKLYGGTEGTSYHDVLTAAGVRDLAAERYRNWPDYSPEELLVLDPDLVVTYRGMQQLFCNHPGLDRLRACRTGRVIGIDAALLQSPGLEMLEAAEALFEAVHERVDR